MVGHKIKRYTSTLSLPDRENRARKDVETVGAEIELINSVLVRIKYLGPECCN